MSYSNPQIICMIPARLGSVRVPRKNLRKLHGKPMIAYSIEAALKSDLFSDVHVCTESQEIADAAAMFGATPHLVPDELCGDLMPSWKPCVHVCDTMIAQGQRIDALLCLQPTSPLRTKDDIQRGVQQFIDTGADFLVSITDIDPHYFHWAMHSPTQEDLATDWQMVFGSKYMIERPLLPKRYRPNGSIKIARLNALREVGHFFGERLAIIETPDERSIHVGNSFEFDVADFLLGRTHDNP